MGTVGGNDLSQRMTIHLDKAVNVSVSRLTVRVEKVDKMNPNKRHATYDA